MKRPEVSSAPWVKEPSVHGATIRAADGDDVAQGVCNDADADLIVAAPAMLKTLQQVQRIQAMDIAQLERLPKHEQPTPASFAAYRALAKRVRETVTLAQGGAPPEPSAVPLDTALEAPELLVALKNLVAAIERAAAAGIDTTGYIGVGDALTVIARAEARR